MLSYFTPKMSPIMLWSNASILPIMLNYTPYYARYPCYYTQKYYNSVCYSVTLKIFHLILKTIFAAH